MVDKKEKREDRERAMCQMNGIFLFLMSSLMDRNWRWQYDARAHHTTSPLVDAVGPSCSGTTGTKSMVEMAKILQTAEEGRGGGELLSKTIYYKCVHYQ